ncbi:MAG TPA: hypothetical protein VHC90_03450, partial [Bryobacteraceae bacterium]|nr:hypothetical protein [Bryobacteraceae bacterium]
LIWSDPVKSEIFSGFALNKALHLQSFFCCRRPSSVPAGAAHRGILLPERRGAVQGAPLFGAA